MGTRGRRWGWWTGATGLLGLGSSAAIAPQAVLVLAWGLVGLGLIVVLTLLLILFCEAPSRRLRELVREVRRRPCSASE